MPKYSYIDKTGQNKFIEAETPELAIKSAPDIAPTSGVQLEKEEVGNRALNILGIPGAGTEPKPSGFATSDDLRIKETKEAEDKAKADADLVVERDRLKIQREVADLKVGLAPSGGAPAIPGLEAEYRKLISETDPAGQSYTSIQARMVDLNRQKEESLAQFRKFKQVTPEGVSLGFAQGTISAEGQKVQDQIDFINRQIQTESLLLSNRADTINALMGFKKEDYANVSARYDKDLATSITLYNTLGTQKDKLTDNARASLQMIWNEMKAGNLDYETLPSDQKSIVDNFELQAGFPKGFTSFVHRNILGDIKSVASRTDEEGNEYFDVLSIENGNLKTTSIFRGKAKPTGTGNEDQLIRDFSKRVGDLVGKIDNGDMSYDAAVRSLQAEFGPYGFSDQAIYGALGESK